MATINSRPDHPGALSTADLHVGLKVILHIGGGQFPLEIRSDVFLQKLPGTDIEECAIRVRGGVSPGDYIRLLGSLGTEPYSNGMWSTNYLTRA